ncbi:hypothetical protein [Paracoccus sp. 22332]|uniref:hypothetical protein n=1 Tax=Paracoccus sp. 22332 TaxID=3453913 RepID=UPI003F87F502
MADGEGRNSVWLAAQGCRVAAWDASAVALAKARQLDHGTGGPRLVENLYTPQMLQDAFAGWDIPVLRSYEAHLAEGAAHAGPSALIDLIARRPG